MTLRRRLVLVSYCAFFLAAFAGVGAYAAEQKSESSKYAVGNKNDPALLVAKEVHYDQKNSVAKADGDVEIDQAGTILRADHVTYNLNTDVVTADGHVTIMQPDGDVFFADHANLTRKMQQGAVQGFKARLKDNSLFAAKQGTKVSKDVTHMKHLVYSPCKVCKDTADAEGGAPLWQIQAREGTLDEEAKRVSYRDAFLDVYGVPTLYTPYFSHPTPDAPSQSGFLTPEYFNATDLGNVVKTPLFLSLAPNMDATLTPWYLSNEKPLLAGEFRDLFKEGSFKINGAITDTYNRDDSGNIIPGDEIRGYIEAHAIYQINDLWKAGLDAERTTDDTFLQLYRFGWRDVLTSRLYTERIQDRDYFSVEALSFQGLTQQDDSRVSPTVLPKTTYHYESDPGWEHSRITADGSLLSTERDEGVSTRRASGTVGWKIPYITKGGQIFEAGATMRADVYDLSDEPIDSTTRSEYSGMAERAIPQIDLNWRYPFITRFGEGKSLMVAPIAEFTESPNTHFSSKFPDEDSQVTELNDANLFSPDRFTGLDQVETGPRFTYGTRGHLQNRDDEFVEWLLGQTYQENEDNAFPIAQDINAHYSDYIGDMTFKYHWIDLTYSFRLDRDTFNPISNSVNTILNVKPVYLDLSYVSLRQDPIFGNRQEIFGNFNWDVTPTWQLGLNGRRDLGSNDEANVTSASSFIQQQELLNPLQPTPGTVGLGSSLTYHNECIKIVGSVGRSYISQADVRPSTTFGVMLTLNNFGKSNDAAASPDVSGAGNIGSTETTASPVSDTRATGSVPAAAPDDAFMNGNIYPTGAIPSSDNRSTTQ